MGDKECMDQLSMINAMAIVTKLKNRVWADETIKETLNSLETTFEESYQEFSSFDKWQK
jgi:hypothetical protein